MHENNERFFSALKEYIKEIDKEIMKGTESNGLTISNLDDPSSMKPRTRQRTYEIVDRTKGSFQQMLIYLETADFKYEVINYSRVTEIIFEYTDNELFDMLEMYLEDSWDLYKSENDNLSESLERRFLKVKEHIILSVKQKSQITNSLAKKYQDFYTKFNEVQKDFADLENKLTNAQESLKDLKTNYEEKYNNIITQFITILGIFSAILMGAFGSIQGFTSLFENAFRLSMGEILVISSIGGSAVVLILFFLLHGLSKLTGHKLSSCNCHLKRKGFTSFFSSIKNMFSDNYYDDNVCNCSLFEKYPTVIIIHYLFYFIIATGFILIYFETNPYSFINVESPIVVVSVIIIYYIFAILILLFIHIAFVTKRKDRKWYQLFNKNN